MNTNLIALDFSMNKPALSAFINGKLYFYVWPLNIDSKTEFILQENSVVVYNRHLDSIHPKDFNDSTMLTQIHIKRAIDLSDKIVKDIEYLIHDYKDNTTYLSTEGLSFGSTGNEALNLATYKAILLADIAKRLNIWNFYTYSPITIKSTAGCSKKGSYSKLNMIESFMKEKPLNDFMLNIINHTDVFKKKVNFIDTVDDIVDSYFCLKTMYKKLKLTGITEWNE